jgi:hypothetical protein
MLNHNSRKNTDSFSAYIPHAFKTLKVNTSSPVASKDSHSHYAHEPESPPKSIFNNLRQRVSGNLIEDAPKLK